MENSNWEEDDGSGSVAGLFNGSHPLFVLPTVEPSWSLISAASGSINYVGDSANKYFNGKGQETVATTEPGDCFGCSGYHIDDRGGGGAAVGNQTNSSVNLGYNTSTVSLFSFTCETDENDALYVMPLALIIFWCILYLGISAMALIGNTLVMWVVGISRKMRTVTNMFIANLALADFIIGLFTIPFQFQAALRQRWDLPDFMCAICPFVQVLSVNVSVFTLSAIAVDRYRAVLFPLSPRVSKRKAAWAILTIWTIAFAIAFPTWLDYKVVKFEADNGETKPFCSNTLLNVTFRMYYSLVLLVIQYIFPLLILTGAYAHMTTKLWGTQVPGNKEESRDAVVLRNKKKVIKMLAVVVLLFAVCWLPLQMYNVLQIFIPCINTFKYINITWFCFHSLAMSNSCCNPFIYAIYNDKFQREFRARIRCIVLRCRWCKRRAKSEEDINNSDISDFDGTGAKSKSSLRPKHRNTIVCKNQKDAGEMTTELNEGKRSVKSNNDHEHNRHQQTSRRIKNQNSSKNTTHIQSNDTRSRNNNRNYKSDSPDEKQKTCNGINGAVGKRLSEKAANNRTFTPQIVPMVQIENEESSLSAQKQIAVVCPNSKPSSNVSMVTITIVAKEGVCQL